MGHDVRAGIVASFALAGIGCSTPYRFPAEDFTVEMSPTDLATGQSPDVLPLVRLSNYRPWGSVEGFVAEELPFWNDHLRLVRWPTGELVPGRWVFSNDTAMTFTFEPESPLEPGWYAVQVDFRGLPVVRGTLANTPQVLSGSAGPAVGTAVIEGVTTARFFVGSRPIAQMWGAITGPSEGRDGGGNITLFVTEPVSLDREQATEDLLMATVDGEPVRCVPFNESIPVGIFRGLSWECDDPGRSGDVVVTMQPFAGAPPELRYGASGSPLTWTSGAGGWIDPRVVSDSVFEP